MVNRSGPAATLSGYPVELLREWLRTSCEAQGVPVVVRDAQVVANVAALLGVSSPQGRGADAGARLRVAPAPSPRGRAADQRRQTGRIRAGSNRPPPGDSAMTT